LLKNHDSPENETKMGKGEGAALRHFCFNATPGVIQCERRRRGGGEWKFGGNKRRRNISRGDAKKTIACEKPSFLGGKISKGILNPGGIQKLALAKRMNPSAYRCPRGIFPPNQ